MRRFVDHHGREWETVLGRGSWGVYVILFAPLGLGAEVREVELAATSLEDALDEIERLSDQDLADMVEQALPKSE